MKDFYQKHTKLTRSLKKFISEQQAQFSQEVFESFLDQLSAEIGRVKEVLLAVPAGPLRARRLQELVDQEIAQEHTIPASCFKGCSHCCHVEVEITNYETEILRGRLAQGFEVDPTRLRLQSQRELQDPAWRDLNLKPQNRCVFLNNEGACGIYEDRPVMCRRHSVTSSPKHCESLDEKIVLRYFPRVDLILSAANEDPDLRIGPLAQMLIRSKN